jgi:hypothetical protein
LQTASPELCDQACRENGRDLASLIQVRYMAWDLRLHFCGRANAAGQRARVKPHQGNLKQEFVP